MAFFSRKKKTPGWLAISFQPDGICAAHVRRVTDAQPVVEWVSFYPANRNALVETLERLEKDRAVSAHECSNLLSLGEYQMLSLEAPAVAPEELKSAVRWRLKDMLDYHVDDATIDVLSVPGEKGAGSRSDSLFAIAARNQMIQQRQTIFDNAKLPLRVIDIPEMAQRNMAALLEPERTALVVLSLNAEGMLVTVTFGGELYLVRQIAVTAAQLQQADSQETAELHERIALELQRTIDHFDRQYQSIPVSQLVLAPMGQGAELLQDYLSTNMHIPVSLLELGSILDLSRSPELKQVEMQQRFFLVIGAALRQEERAL
ncbi:MAG: agglutinin biogenesis protein MshI [Burkholderiaceae bacterium]|nr:agglutinin biogenesis protein MshI [Burkholderiaceae bacterium]